MKALPEAFVSRMKTLLGAEYEAYEASFGESAVRAFRVNTNKISLEDFEKINIFSKEKMVGYKIHYRVIVAENKEKHTSRNTRNNQSGRA